MLRSYFKIAYRNLLRHRAYSLINILGLAIGISSVILISLFVIHEFRYDRHHEHIDRLFRVIREDVNGSARTVGVTASGGEAHALATEFPGVEAVCRWYPEPTWIANGRNGFMRQFVLVDTTAFDVFTIPFIEGDPETAFKQKNSAIITEETARLLFGEGPALGQTLSVHELNTKAPLLVTGVVEDQPVTTTTPFDVLSATLIGNKAGGWNEWDFNKIYAGGPEIIVLLREGADSAPIERALNELAANRNPMESTVRFHLRPLDDSHLYLRAEFGILGSAWEGYGSIEEVYAYAAIAFIILLIACVNFMNLTTARATNRIREVGLRKVAGAIRTQIIYQFLGEAILLSLLAFLIACVVVDLGVGAFGNLIGRDLSWGVLRHSAALVLLLPILAALTGVIAGSYPAFYLSRFSPAEIMGSGPGGRPRGAAARRVLVVVQFGLSVVFLVSALVVRDQLEYVRTKDLGFDRERIVEIPIFRRSWEVHNSHPRYDLRWKFRQVKERALKIPNVLATTSSRFTQGVYATSLAFETQGQEHRFSMFDVDEDYVDFFGLEVVAGRNLRETDLPPRKLEIPPHVPPESIPPWARESLVYPGKPHFLLNESAAKALGWGSDVEGRSLRMKTDRSQGKPGVAVGTLRNFHIESLHAAIKPAVFRLFNGGFKFLYLKIGPNDVPGTIEHIRALWEELLPERPFEFAFLDDKILTSHYEDEMRLSRTFGALSGLAIIVACMGLFGLASYIAEQKQKEIGIRKVLGASRGNIIQQLGGTFLIQIAIANLVGWPIAYWAMRGWLDGFAYRIDLGFTPFLLAAVITTILTALTISGRALSAASTDPVKAIRVE